jgi:HD-GYP domain-containing protein (c-di-GMP phosphodiesterase class II)
MHYLEAISTIDHSLRGSGGRDLTDKLRGSSSHSARHSFRVSDLAVRVACTIPDIDETVIVNLGFSGALHDVGKAHPSIVGLVNSPDRLEVEEEDLARLRTVHTQEGGRMIEALVKGRTSYRELLGTAAYTARHHHDPPETLPARVNGSSLTPRVAGLIHVIDRFDAMASTDRPYRNGALGLREEVAALIMGEVEVQPFYGVAPETLMGMLVELDK